MVQKVKRRGLFIGLATLDVVNRVDRFPKANEKVTSLEQTTAAGGPATNAAVVFSALGGKATLLTALGPGAVAGIIRAELSKYNVTVIDAADHNFSGVPISSVCVNAANGERSVISIDSSINEVSPFTHIDKLLMDADIVHIDGHYAKLTVRAVRAAAQKRKNIFVDAGRWKPIFSEIFPFSEAVICSDDFRIPGTKNSTNTALQLRRQGIPIIVTTHGAKPIRWWEGKNSGSIKVPAIRAVDTLGAGDAFHGSYAYFSCDEAMPLKDRLMQCAQIASFRCGVAGPRAWLAELPQFLAKINTKQWIL